MDRQVRVVAAGLLAKRRPGLYRYVAVGLRRELQDYFARIDIGLDSGHAVGHAFDRVEAVQFA